jgi:NADPH2:quinone reductase
MAMARNPAHGRAQLEEILGWAKDGSLRPHVHARYPLAKALDALLDVEQRRVQGKAVVVVGGGEA